MVCVYCGGDTRVVNSRHQARGNRVWRRRKCLACKALFSTEEAARLEAAWRVAIAGSGRLQPFSRDKLFLSVYDSCQHRKTALGDAEGLTATIIRKLAAHVKDGTIEKSDITGVAQVALNRFDKAASVYYGARHKS